MSYPRVLGIDPASRQAGLAVVEGDVLLYSEQITLAPHQNSDELAESLAIFARRVDLAIKAWQPSLIVVEHTTVFRNLNTTKLLTYYEAVALLAAAKHNILVERARTKQARKAVVGNGSMPKEQVVEWVCYKYDSKFKEDEAEAIVFALFGSTILS